MAKIPPRHALTRSVVPTQPHVMQEKRFGAGEVRRFASRVERHRGRAMSEEHR